MTAAELRQAAKDRRSVKPFLGFKSWPENRPVPAAWVLNMNWSIVDRHLATIELYEPKKRDLRKRCDWCRKRRAKMTRAPATYCSVEDDDVELCDECLAAHDHEQEAAPEADALAEGLPW